MAAFFATALVLLLLPCMAAILHAATGATQPDAGSNGAATQAAFLGPHNAARAEVGVAPLVWDDAVAAYAQELAAARQPNCELRRSFGRYGENLFWGSLGGNWTAADAVRTWVDERQYYNCVDESCSEPTGASCSHYTQVVWANTTRLGCANVTCANNGGLFFACEYDPPGNVQGARPYSGCAQLNRTSAQNSPKDFLDLQNAARTAVGVGALLWDRNVAAYAQRYAEARSRDCLKLPSGGRYGENIFIGEQGVNSTATDALLSWIGEQRHYSCSNNTCESGNTCSDYTQIVWANSTSVGCASAACDKNRGGGTFIICNYDPPGNVAGERPYSQCGQAPGDTNLPRVEDNKNRSSKSRNVILPIVLSVVALGLISAILNYAWRRSRLKRKLSWTTSSEDIEDLKSVLLDPAVIRAATDNFAEVNKLGEGGFGQVYKGSMSDGQEIAVKRLASGSNQGLRELKNELLLVAKLQHRNLVKLIGACLDGEDKLLVYEYIANKSLDAFIYDDQKREEMAWDTRYKIICGIARGLVYLHDESRVKVIHRDLKPSNILLETDMNPKISDFGLASVFEGDHSKNITRRVAGTYGYMAPEYAVLGHVSVKSDVFSFGVIILEIVTGRRNSVSSSETMMAQHLLSYVWDNWIMGTITEIVDSSLRHNCVENVVLKCIHIGLLCVQENPSDRPNMSNVILMLVGRSTTLPTPSRPAFLFRLDDSNHAIHEGKSNPTFNKLTITGLEPR